LFYCAIWTLKISFIFLISLDYSNTTLVKFILAIIAYYLWTIYGCIFITNAINAIISIIVVCIGGNVIIINWNIIIIFT
jgi:hypothetical protein